jgi:hypothetical protein
VYCREGRKDDLLAFADAALAPVGGRLFEGYRSLGPRDAPEETLGGP